MHKHITTAVLLGALSLVPFAGYAATAARPPAPAAKHASAGAVATHSTTGVVKSIDASKLVITRMGKKQHEMTFVLNPSTQREGTVAAGTPVSVRYRAEGKAWVATAIRARSANPQTASAKR